MVEEIIRKLVKRKHLLPKFRPGEVFVTNGVDALVDSHEEVVDLLDRHVKGFWGDISEEDKQANEVAVESGDVIMSSYQLREETVWVITEPVGDSDEREHTTILFPNEY